VGNRKTEGRRQKAAALCVATVRCLVAAALLPALLAALAAPVQAQSIQQVQEQVKFEQRLNQPLPLDARFKDEGGRDVALGDYFGKRPVIVALVYYECPMLCNLVLNGLLKSIRTLKFTAGKEFDIVVISFNPRETPALAARKKDNYVREYARVNADLGWHFLTGTEDSIQRVTQAAGFSYIWDAGTNQYAHASGILVATPQGKLYRYFYGIEYAPRDVRFALIEASENKLGTPVDALMLYCFHYDAATGKYGVVVHRVLRLAGITTVALIAGFVLVMLRRERRGELAVTGQPASRA